MSLLLNPKIDAIEIPVGDETQGVSSLHSELAELA
jgi:hypothetical protein